MALTLTLFMPDVTDAHVRLQPLESVAGMVQTYTVRVPTEGNVATTEVDLEIPTGIVVIAVPEPGSATKRGGQTISITWTTQIPPGESRQFTFDAMNPASAQEVVWKAHQHFADGSDH